MVRRLRPFKLSTKKVPKPGPFLLLLLRVGETPVENYCGGGCVLVPPVLWPVPLGLLVAGISRLLLSSRSWLTHSWRGSLCALRRPSRLSYGRRRHKKRQGDKR